LEEKMAKTPKTLEDLFHDSLKDVLFAEKKILAALPKMARAAESAEMEAAFKKHREETQVHVERLEQIFEMLGKRQEEIKINVGKKIKKYSKSYG